MKTYMKHRDALLICKILIQRAWKTDGSEERGG